MVWKTHCSLKFHFGQFDWSEICTEGRFTPLKVMWMLIVKLPHTEVKFYPEVKSQTGLSSLWVSCKRADIALHHIVQSNSTWLLALTAFLYIHLAPLRCSFILWTIFCKDQAVWNSVFYIFCFSYGHEFLKFFSNFVDSFSSYD